MPKEAKKRTSSSTASACERAAIAELVKAARERGDDITGPEGLLARLGLLVDGIKECVVPDAEAWAAASSACASASS